MDRIHLRLDRGRRIEECVLTEADRRFQGLDWYELLEYFALSKQAAKAAEPNQRQAAARYHAHINKIINEAKTLNNAVAGRVSHSKRSRIQGIRENRQSLKLYERKNGPPTSSSKVTPNTLAPVVPINQLNKSEAGSEYIPPVRPHNEIRKVREEAKKRGK